MGRIHAAILRDDPRVRLAAIHDASPERAAESAAEFGAKAVATLDELWKLCDAVWVCAPNFRHGELALAAVAQNKHVFCEKPM